MTTAEDLPEWMRLKWELSEDPHVSTWMRTGVRAIGRGLPSTQELYDVRRLLAVVEARHALAVREGRESFSGATRAIDITGVRTSMTPTQPFGEGLIAESQYLGEARVVTKKIGDTTHVAETQMPDGQTIKHYRGGW
jgi:hypothetical protein